MKNVLYILLLLLSLSIYSQEEKVFVISDSILSNGWVGLIKDWHYQKGDNKAWAKPDYDDSDWKEFSNYNLNMPDNKTSVANRGEIAWFRKRIKADSTLKNTIVLSIFQLGASEIYLDGELINQLGRISRNPKNLEFDSDKSGTYQLPLVKGKEQVLAIRYINGQSKFPLFSSTNGIVTTAVSSLNNLNTNNVTKNYRIAATNKLKDYYNIAAGIGILMFIIFLSFYLFFPKERINGYFALSILFLIIFLFGNIAELNQFTASFWLGFFYITSILISIMIGLFCTYTILEQKRGFVFKVLVFMMFLSIALFFLFEARIVAAIFANLIFIETIRIAIKSRRKNPVGSLIFLITSGVLLLFWFALILILLGLFFNIHIWLSVPISFMLNPMAFAIYLGYAFGKRSQELRLNLKRVQKLSKEKESILYNQNATLELQVKERTSEVNRSLEDLKATQSQLIKSEKLASLGQLAAGIAHEIKNPLNFVNNFSELNLELIDEIKDELGKLPNSAEKTEIETILVDVISNQKKIHQHGTRADSIVKSMLLHSRGGTGIKEPTDINRLLKEYVNLSFHGMRAGKKPINVTLNFQLDETIPKIPLIMEDISRVILNLCNNAFDAMYERLQTKKDSEEYQPKLTITTYEKDKQIIIEITDNALGIPLEIKDKILMPFFTTKKGTEGTGLGLSITNDIIEAHGGSLQIESKQGKDSFTTFKINLTT